MWSLKDTIDCIRGSVGSSVFGLKVRILLTVAENVSSGEKCD